MLPKKELSKEIGCYSSSEEWLNFASHGLGFVFALFGTAALINIADSRVETVSAIVYGFSLALMFLSSTLYHYIKSSDVKPVLRKIDHTAIYLLIAGSYTPVLLLSVGGTLGILSLIAIWCIGLLGVGFKLTIGDRYPKLGVITYAFMGWFALLLIYPIYHSLSQNGMVLLVAGGLFYTAGIPFYMMKTRHYTHALWHVFVVLGAISHFFMIYSHVM